MGDKKEKSSGDQKPKSPKGGGGKDKFDEAALEKEFQAFVGKLKRQYGPNSLAYQISNHPEGVEFSVRVAKKAGPDGSNFTATFSKKGSSKKPRDKELTEEQKKKSAKRNEKLRLKREQKEKENENPEKKPEMNDTKVKTESEKENLNEKVIA